MIAGWNRRATSSGKQHDICGICDWRRIGLRWSDWSSYGDREKCWVVLPHILSQPSSSPKKDIGGFSFSVSRRLIAEHCNTKWGWVLHYLPPPPPLLFRNRRYKQGRPGNDVTNLSPRLEEKAWDWGYIVIAELHVHSDDDDECTISIILTWLGKETRLVSPFEGGDGGGEEVGWSGWWGEGWREGWGSPSAAGKYIS